MAVAVFVSQSSREGPLTAVTARGGRGYCPFPASGLMTRAAWPVPARDGGTGDPRAGLRAGRGAVALTGASKDVSGPAERSKIAASGWARWAPFGAVAIGAHLLGGGGLLLAHRDRVRNQPGVGANTAIKTALTVAALGTTAYSGLLGAKLSRAVGVEAEGGAVPGGTTPDDVAQTQQQLRILQWITPILTGAQQGEQQRPGQRIRSWRKNAA